MAGTTWVDHPRLAPIRAHPVGGVVLETIGGYQRHKSGRNAALIAFFAFTSVFPLMLVMTTVLGFVLDGNEELQEDIVDSALGKIPIVGQQINVDPSALKGSVVALVLGLATSLWSGMRAFVAYHDAVDDTWEVPPDERDSGLQVRLKALAAIAIVGATLVATAFLTSLAGVSQVNVAGKVGLVIAAALVNIGILSAMAKVLTSRPPGWRIALPGVVIAGVVFAVLQLIGTAVVGRAIANASPVYGTFASVIGLIAWLSLHVAVALYASELNVVLASRSGAAAAPSVRTAVPTGRPPGPVRRSPACVRPR